MRHGRNGADWHVKLTRRRTELLAEVERLAQSERLSAMIDFPKIRRALEDWPASGAIPVAERLLREGAIPRRCDAGALRQPLRRAQPVNAGLRDLRFRRLVLALALLQIAAALTEGVGLVLLVPLLSALAGPTGADAGPLVRAAAGLSQNLPALLALFVLLVAARSALVLARSRAALTLELALVDGLRQRAWQALLGGRVAAAAGPTPL